MICDVPEGPKFASLLLSIYTNDLCNSTLLLEAISFADDTNIFYSHNNVKGLFKTMDAVLSNLDDWFCANKLSMNTDKIKYFLFHKAKSKDSFSLALPDLFINDVKIKRKN